MSTDMLERTGKVNPEKKGMGISSADDLNELSDEELKNVTGGSSCNSSSGIYTVGGGSNGSQTITYQGFTFTRKVWESIVDTSLFFSC
jgi:bacteriocin-like protein